MTLSEEHLIKRAKELLEDGQRSLADEIHYPVQMALDEDEELYELKLVLTRVKTEIDEHFPFKADDPEHYGDELDEEE